MTVFTFATAVFLIIYVLTVKNLRFKRRNALLRKYDGQCRSKFKALSLQDAFAIQLSLAELEFPRTFSLSVFFAIFKTYGIPSISALLAATGQLSNETSSSKRAADTGILIVEAVLNEPGSQRSLDAVARMNYLHAKYRKAGKIKDEDMLFTLSLFALEPIRWTSRFEWRDLTDLERCAMGVYWKALGDMMDIPFEALPSAKSGWQDGLHWLEELETWSGQYEACHMVPAESNNKLAVNTIEIALTNVPQVFHALGHQFVSALLSARLRTAMNLPMPTLLIRGLLNSVMNCRKWILRYFCLPRSDSARELWFSQTPDPKTGRYHAVHYIDRPWYIEPTFTARWNVVSWLLWLVGGHVPSLSTPENRPEGYKITELGPTNMEGKGIPEMNEAKELLAKQVKGCPFFHRSVG